MTKNITLNEFPVKKVVAALEAALKEFRAERFEAYKKFNTLKAEIVKGLQAEPKCFGLFLKKRTEKAATVEFNKRYYRLGGRPNSLSKLSELDWRASHTHSNEIERCEIMLISAKAANQEEVCWLSPEDFKIFADFYNLSE